MPQIINGKSPAWVAGEIVTASGLNSMVDAAILDPSAVTAQTNFPTLTGNEYALIVDPVSGLLKKTQLKNSLLTGNNIITGSIANSIGGINVTANTEVRLNAPVIYLDNHSTVGSSIEVSTDQGINFVTSNGGIYFNAPSGTTTFASPVTLSARTTFNATSSMKIPVGTTGQRPAVPVTGDMRYNSTISFSEIYNGSAWQSFNPINAVALTASGYIKLDNGFTIQWGTFTSNGSSTFGSPQIVPLAVTFTTAIVYANASEDGGNSAAVEYAILDWATAGKTTTSQLGVYTNYTGICKFIAVGY